MNIDIENSITLITSSSSNNRYWGTGFVIHQDENVTYVATCAHIVKAVGEYDNVIVDGYNATVIALDTEEGFDVAVLRVEKRIDKMVSKLSRTTVREGSPFITGGFVPSANKSLIPSILLLRGVLNRQVGILSPNLQRRGFAWDFRIEDTGNLQPGYSGAPIIDETSGNVVAIIIRQKGGENNRGLAISIDVLKKIWDDMPENLLEDSKLSQLKTDIIQLKSKPLINFNKEITAFHEIIANQDTKIRLILIHGAAGMGKTRLLIEYQQIAITHNLKTLFFDLRMMNTIDRYIYEIASLIGIQHFPSYLQFSKSGKPDTPMKEEEWYQHLTQAFFEDLKNYTDTLRLVIFFDGYERSDRTFKNWLNDTVFSSLLLQPLIVVVASREKIENLPFSPDQLQFELGGVSLASFYQYVKQLQVHLPDEQIALLHQAVRGQPSTFIQFIESQVVRGGTL